MKKRKGTFEKKLKAYSAVAAGTLLLAPSANAAIQYSGPMNWVVNNGNTVLVDLNNDGFNDFAFSQSYAVSTYFFMAFWHISTTNPTTLGGLDMINASNPHNDVANLPSGYLIRSTLTDTNLYWNSGWQTLAGYAYTDGNFNYNGTQGFLGVRFISAACPVGGPPHYGWIQWRTDSRDSQGTIIDWAYEDSCAPILAGDRGAPAVSVPTLNQWGLFALIALLAGAGVMRLRKQEEV